MRNLLTTACLLLLTACSPSVTINKSPALTPAASDQPILVMPVVSIMCPEDVSEAFFDSLINRLNTLGSSERLRFVILKQDPSTLPEATLSSRTYVTGEIFGCLEETGCCSGEIMMTMRLELFQPGQEAAVLRMRYPVERFFDLEAATPDQARVKLASDTAEQAASDLLKALSNPAK